MKTLVLIFLLLSVYTVTSVKIADSASFQGVYTFSVGKTGLNDFQKLHTEESERASKPSPSYSSTSDVRIGGAVDGGWSDFSAWGACSRTCGKGRQTRVRTCTNPPPQNGGRKCNGQASEHRPCNDKGCPGMIVNIYFPMDGGWSAFSVWTQCSKSCGGGVQKRRRTCSNPYPSNGGKYCTGDEKETKSCNEQLCSVDGGWTDFSVWSDCSSSCGGGIQTRNRSCTNPTPKDGGKFCSGPDEESRKCNEEPCSESNHSPPRHGWSPRMEERFGIRGGTAEEENAETNSRLFKTYEADSKSSRNMLINEVTTIPLRVDSLSSDPNRRRRREKRNNSNTHSRGDKKGRPEAQSDCTPKPFWLSLNFYFAISGWGCFAVAVGMYISFKCKCGQKYREFRNWQARRRGSDEVESTDNAKPASNPKKQSRRTEDSLEIISESDYGDRRHVSYTPKEFLGMSHHDLKQDRHVAERKKIIKKVTLEPNKNDLHSGIQYAKSVVIGAGDRERDERKSAEKRSIIKGHDVMNRRYSLVDELQYARSIIMDSDQDRQHNRKAKENRKLIRRKSMDHTGGLNEDLLQYAAHVLVHDKHEKQHDHQASEKRRVIKEAMANERRGSLLDDLQFAKSVINPDSRVRYLDREALERRQKIKSTHESTHRRMSLKDDLLIAQAIITPTRVDEENLKARADAKITVDPYDDWV